MNIGTLRIRLLVRESRSLKDKRQVLRSIKYRLRQQFNVSVSEVEAEDHRQLIVLGLAMVSNEGSHIRQEFESIVRALRAHPVAEFVDHEIDI